MKLLTKVFAKIGSYPLMNPHDGYEGTLLAHGSKPVGLLVPPPGHPDVDEPDFITQIREQVVIADAAVAAGLILKTTIIVPPPSRYSSDETMTGHVYAQPAYRADMMEMADFLKKLWSGEEPPDPSQNNGIVFGYSEADIALCGKFESLNPVSRFSLRKPTRSGVTAGCRRCCPHRLVQGLR